MREMLDWSTLLLNFKHDLRDPLSHCRGNEQHRDDGREANLSRDVKRSELDPRAKDVLSEDEEKIAYYLRCLSLWALLKFSRD